MTTSTLKPEASLRKAAVLVRSLDPDAVATLLARLSPAEAKAVRMAVRELENVSDEDRELVAADLRRSAIIARPAETAPAPEPPALREAPASPLDGLNSAPPAAIASFLTIEQPATVAVVLSCLAPSRAGEVLEHLPEELQADAVDRLAELGEIDPESLHVIAAELQTWITKHTQQDRLKQDRRKTLQAILRASSPAVRRRLVGRLGGEDLPCETAPPVKRPRLERPPIEERPLTAAKQVVPHSPSPPPLAPPSKPTPRLPFRAVESLPAAQLAEVIQRVDQQTLVLALLGASETLMGKLKSLATRKQMRKLEESIRRVGPVRLSDIEQAQQRIAECAARLVLGKGVG